MRMFRAGIALAIAGGLVTAWKVAPPVDTLWQGLLTRASTFNTYYVSPTGNNRASGKSPADAWRTLARASEARLRPGDRLLLRGRYVYHGSLAFGSSDSGTSAHRVLIGSYGRGRATILSPSSGIFLADTANITITNLNIAGRRTAMRPGTSGIQLYSTLTNRRLAHVVIEKVNVSGFGYGIGIGGIHKRAGFRDVWVVQSALHGNLDAGLAIYGPAFGPNVAPSYANSNVHIVGVRAFGNRGNPANVSTNSGSGMVLSSVVGATVTRSSAYDNGGAGSDMLEGPEGIWAYDASHVVIEHDVAYDNKSKSKPDGGGFELDQSTFDSVIEYDLSYRNHGPGYLLYAGKHSPQSGNVIRFNISYHDGLDRALLGGIAVSGRTANAAVYQNTVVMEPVGPQTTLKLNGALRRDRVFNNIFVGSSRGPLVYGLTQLTSSQVRLAGNDYVAPPGDWLARWSSARYHSLAAWRTATGQEHVDGKRTGLTAAPLFVHPAPAQSGGAGFALRRASMLRNRGLNLVRLFGLQPGKVNYAGKSYRFGRPNIGAQ